MNFDDHLERFIQNRAQQKRIEPNRKAENMDATQQSQARNAMAKAQIEASKRAETETKQPHICVNGRYRTESEWQQLQQKQSEPTPVNTDRLIYIQTLRKNLKLKQHIKS